MAGLTAAEWLTRHGWKVVIVDKGRGLGGRMATRRIGGSRFDHGAQFFTVRDSSFAAVVAAWQAAGLVQPWFEEGGHVRFRTGGGMSQLARHLAGPFDVRTGVRLESVSPSGSGWLAVSDSGERFEAPAVLITAPPAQALELLSGCRHRLAPDLVRELESVDFDPCFAAMAVLAGPSAVPAPGWVRPAAGPVEWLADNTAKGISTGPGAVTIHAGGAFSREHFDAAPDHVLRQLLAAAEPWLGSPVVTSQLHRWKFAKPVAGTRPSCLFTATPAPLAFAGDGLSGGRVEGAFLSGRAAAETLRIKAS